MLEISGYKINKRFHTNEDLISVLQRKLVITKSKADARSILNIMRSLGARYIFHDDGCDWILNAPGNGCKGYCYYLDYSKYGLCVVAFPQIWLNLYDDLECNYLKVSDIVAYRSVYNQIQDYL